MVVNNQDKEDNLNINQNNNLKLKIIHIKTKIKNSTDNNLLDLKINKVDKIQLNNKEEFHLNLLHKI